MEKLTKMPRDRVLIFDNWRELARLILEQRDEEKQNHLVKLLRYSYHEEMLRRESRHEVRKIRQ